jgi:hypothetical protein
VFVPRSLGLVAEGNFQDPHNARLLYLASGGLLLLGLALGIGTWLWWRSSKVEHPALGPLEVMSQRSWSGADFESQRRRLDEARPAGAERQFVPPTEVEFDDPQHDSPADFGDLAEPSAEVPVAVEASVEVSVESAVEAVARPVIDPLLRSVAESDADEVPAGVDDTPV